MFTDEQVAIRDSARRFVRQEILPNILEWEEAEQVPRHIWKAFGELGFCGVALDTRHGGSGCGATAWALMIEELAYGDCAIANQIGGICYPFGAKVSQFGTPEQCEKFLKPAIAGDYYISLLLSEPHAGSDLAQVRTRAERRDGRWIVNGEKTFITGGASSGAALLLAATDPMAGKKGLTAFLIRPGMPGYTVVRREKKMGHRVMDICQITLDDLELADEHVLGEVGEGYGIILEGLDSSRIGVAAQSVGVAQSAYDQALAYARERRSFGKAIFDHQAIGFKLAEMATRIEAARQLYLHAARLKESDARCIQESSMAKLFASETAEFVCSAAVQIFGGAGYVGGSMVEKLYRDQRVLQIYEGTNEILKLIIQRELTP